jgi:hypothetical protein
VQRELVRERLLVEEVVFLFFLRQEQRQRFRLLRPQLL